MCTKYRKFLYNNIINFDNNDNNIHITPCMVQNGTDTLKSGKSCGNDGVSAEHLKHADTRTHICYSYCYCPFSILVLSLVEVYLMNL